jgi:hypothetical protein
VAGDSGSLGTVKATAGEKLGKGESLQYSRDS